VLEKADEVYVGLLRSKGNNPEAGRGLCDLLHRAGFSGIVGSASFDAWKTPKEVSELAVALHRGAGIGEQLVSKGIAESAVVEGIRNAYLEWGETPGAFSARAFCEAVGFKPGIHLARKPSTSRSRPATRRPAKKRRSK
jgi:GNAT superfamily N-acetyltransferase